MLILAFEKLGHYFCRKVYMTVAMGVKTHYNINQTSVDFLDVKIIKSYVFFFNYEILDTNMNFREMDTHEFEGIL